MTHGMVTDSPLADVKIRLVESMDDAMDMKRWLGERHDGSPLAVDTETTGFDPVKGHPRLIQIGDKHTGWVIPWDGWHAAAMECITKWEGPFVYHNAPFDNRFMMQSWKGYTPPWERIHETMAMSHLIDPTRPKALKALGDSLVDPRASAGQRVLADAMKANKWTWETVPVDYPGYWIYAGLDPVLTAHVFDKQWPEVSSQFMEPYGIELGATRICTNMMIHGVHVDVPYVQRAIAYYRNTAKEIREWLSQYYGITSPLSGGQIQRAFQSLGVQSYFQTDSGAAQYDKDALAFYKANFPGPASDLADAIRRVRQMEKSIGTYLENFLEKRDSNDILHPTIWVLGAKTSRMSCSDPNLQNLTRDDPVVRGSFSPREGYVFISIDADQIEARLAAHFSEDPGLIAAFRYSDETGEDFFTIISRAIYRDLSIVKKDARRQRTKNVMYAKQFGASTAKMALTAGVPVEQITPVHAALNAQFPGLERLMQRTISEARRNLHHGKPAVYLPTGRRLLATPGKEYTLANYLIQGHAAEILKMGQIRMDALGLGQYMCMPVHDELILEVPKGEALEIKRLAEETLTDRTGYHVPITWSGEIMEERWSKS